MAKDGESEVGYLRVANKEDRKTIAEILYDNGYSVQPVRFKKDGKSFVYLVKYWIGQKEIEPVEVPE